MTSKLSRRHFIQATGAGTALLTIPGFLAGCARSANRAMIPGQTPENPFQQWFGIDEAVIRRVMAELTARGADRADMYFEHTRYNQLRMEDGLISSARSIIDQGVGLRVVIGDQVGFAFTEDLTEKAMKQAANTAAAIASRSALAPPAELRTKATERGFYQVKVPWSQVGIDDKLPLIRRAAELARAADPAVTKVSVYWTDSESRVLIADHTGAVSTDVRPMAVIRVGVTAKKGDVTQSHGSSIAARRGLEWVTDAELSRVANEAVDRTMVLFDARRPPAGELPVVLAAGASGILLHEAIGHGLEADFNRKGTSIYSTMIGKRIAPDFVTIVDDGTLPNRRGALNIDDEGSATENTVLVENGILRSYLHDSISAKHYNVKPTGSGRRESFRHVPMPRMRCTHMLNGPHEREELIAAVKGTGIVAETFTNGQVQIGAGDFTFYIKNGWLIENGKVTAPIKDTNIIGNGPDSLRQVTMAANDSRLDSSGWTCGKNGQGVPVSQGLPTVLVAKMTVGGENA